jgi:hypothetical protein
MRESDPAMHIALAAVFVSMMAIAENTAARIAFGLAVLLMIAAILRTMRRAGGDRMEAGQLAARRAVYERLL